MAQLVIAALDLSDDPLDASTEFLTEVAPAARKMLSSSGPVPGLQSSDTLDAVAFVFSGVTKEHYGWRLAAIQSLAREAAPKRVNGVAGDDYETSRAATDWLANAPGITGQLLAVDGKTAEIG